MAYDMEVNNARFGDQFMRQIEPIAAYVPYTVVVGNHEEAYNFSNYVNRFTMHNSDSNFFYRCADFIFSKFIYFSFDLGNTHFIGLSTEFYFFTNYGFEQIKNQYDWLVADLKVRRVKGCIAGCNSAVN
jgi:hypothetical protein